MAGVPVNFLKTDDVGLESENGLGDLFEVGRTSTRGLPLNVVRDYPDRSGLFLRMPHRPRFSEIGARGRKEE